MSVHPYVIMVVNDLPDDRPTNRLSVSIVARDRPHVHGHVNIGSKRQFLIYRTGGVYSIRIRTTDRPCFLNYQNGGDDDLLFTAQLNSEGQPQVTTKKADGALQRLVRGKKCHD